jgi:hypothetical protein
MNETDLFNFDAMYWREVNFSSPNTVAEIALIEPTSIEGKETSLVVCSLHPFVSYEVEYDIENNGGSFKKTEVKEWPFVLISDLDFYNNEENSAQERKAKIRSVPHADIQSITLKDKNGNVVLKKEKV